MRNTFRYCNILLLLLLISTGCKSENSSSLKAITGTNDPTTAELKLKPGLKIFLTHREWDSDAKSKHNDSLRVLSIKEPSGAEGMAFEWWTPSLVSASNESQASQAPPIGQVFTKISTQSGRLSLPNLTHARRMTLPIFWPEGDLYLSNSTGIWLSDIAFEELKKDRKTQWNPGLFENPLLGPLQGVTLLNQSLLQLQKKIDTNEKEKKKLTIIQANRSPETYSLKIDGKNQEIEVINAENWLASYKVLNNAQNPLILQINLAPQLSNGSILFSPLSILKGLVEYQVVEIQNPEYQKLQNKSGAVLEM